MTNTTLESTDQAPNDSNPFKQTAAIIKPQTKFLLDDGEKCSKNYKYDGSTGNLMQKEIGYEEPLHLIQDISTRWNSSYLAWDWLIFLQYAVLQLSVNLSCSLISEENTDGIRLKKIMIKDNEWELLDELCNILAPFEKATRDFSGNTYVTLSQMFPIITDLTNSLKPSDNLYEVLEDSDDNTINSDIVEEESSQIEVDYTDEITTYFLLPVARENKNPLYWWKSKQENFPVLSIIARKYLGIPATSVASERLFSDAGNHIIAKRSLLDPALLGKMVFLKRNMKTMDHINIFPPDLDVENNDYVEDEHELEELLDE
ncbi:zinc finger BED domain-containing protein 1-like [Rhizophagus clarus]|uniref:Zinc finger BED domain-containing protein 1-like n=1 Tax=Rhizophagus clarus TaxID=94130 RepID=A0A8H3L3E1_9GLOM|nr:zinc finger BED domain-containing protein 1-like [Rhizophagus clarus]